MKECHIIHNSTAPSSSPQNVMVTSLDPASLMVSWDPLPEEDQNGPITYVILYEAIGFTDLMSVTTNGIEYNITGLVPYINYEVEVAARNDNGTIISIPIMQLSGQDSKYLIIIWCVLCWTCGHS